ncbi:MAG: caspase family protein [Planctomycetaceae bacterium]|nr:caspase family protein [Planctomycetaceae bacterium]
MTVLLWVMMTIGLLSVQILGQEPEFRTRGFIPKENGTGTSIKPLHSNFQVGLAVDKSDHLYYEGDTISFTLESSVDGYYYLINLQPKTENGEQHFMVLAPTKNFPLNEIQAGKPITIPLQDEERTIEAQAPFGKDTIVLIVSKKPLKPSVFGLDRFEPKLSTIEQFNRGFSALEALDGSGFWDSDRVEITTLPKNSTDKPKQGKFGLFIAVGKYQIPSLSPLPSIQNIEIVTKTFQQLGYDGNAVITLVDENATRANIKKAFAQLYESTEAGDEVVIYWFGHGDRMAATEITDSPDGERGYLLPYDSKERKPDSGLFVPETLISDLEFGNMIKEIKNRKVLVIIDACFSGTFIDPASLENINPDSQVATQHTEENPFFDFKKSLDAFRTRSISQKDAVAITAAARDEKAWAVKDRFSVATMLLCKHLIQMEDSATIRDVFQAMKNDVLKFIAEQQKNNPSFTIQTPLIQGNAEQFLLKKVK